MHAVYRQSLQFPGDSAERKSERDKVRIQKQSKARIQLIPCGYLKKSLIVRMLFPLQVDHHTETAPPPPVLSLSILVAIIRGSTASRQKKADEVSTRHQLCTPNECTIKARLA